MQHLFSTPQPSAPNLPIAALKGGISSEGLEDLPPREESQTNIVPYALEGPSAPPHLLEGELDLRLLPGAKCSRLPFRRIDFAAAAKQQ